MLTIVKSNDATPTGRSTKKTQGPKYISAWRRIEFSRSIIFRALRDLAKGTQQQKNEAVQWFFSDPDFFQCCRTARMSVDTLRKIAERMTRMDSAGREAYMARIEATAATIRERMNQERKKRKAEIEAARKEQKNVR